MASSGDSMTSSDMGSKVSDPAMGEVESGIKDVELSLEGDKQAMMNPPRGIDPTRQPAPSNTDTFDAGDLAELEGELEDFGS